MQDAAALNAATHEVIEISSDTDTDGNEDNSMVRTDADLFDDFPDVPVDDLNQFLEPYGASENLYGEPRRPDRGSRHLVPTPPTAPASEPDPEDCYNLFLSKILEVFPDHCRDQLKKLYDARFVDGRGPGSGAAVAEAAVDTILQIVQTDQYPKETDRKKNLKRKRSAESDTVEEHALYVAPARQKAGPLVIQEARKALEGDFTKVPLKFIDQQLKQHGNLYPAYLAIQQAEQTYDSNNARMYQRLAKPRKSVSATDVSRDAPIGYGMEEFRNELQTARAKRQNDEARVKKKLDEEKADAALEKECRETGNMVECQCCFTETPMPKATHCKDGHLFCLECVLNFAKSRIELSRYDVICMDGSGCKADFSREERSRFLNPNLVAVLERLQQQAELREANLDDLESCPFCNYAEIYPPVEFDKEFRCRMPECEVISCRLCKTKTHLPKTCAENKKEQGISERHIVEEAMTKALLKICPKCKVPILKDGGCNKLVCSQCRCFVCDFCGKDITKESYGHFDPNNGQSASTRQKCPTTDADYIRNKERIEKAEKEAMAKVRADNPDLSEDDLKVKFSTSVSAESNHGRPLGIQMVMPERLHVGGGRPAADGGVDRRGPGIRQPGFRDILNVPVPMPFQDHQVPLAGAQYHQVPALPPHGQYGPLPPNHLNGLLQQPHRNDYYQLNNMGQELRAELERRWALPPQPLTPNPGYPAEAALNNFYNPLYGAAQPPPLAPLRQAYPGRVPNQPLVEAMNNQIEVQRHIHARHNDRQFRMDVQRQIDLQRQNQLAALRQAQANTAPMDQFREAVQANNARMARVDEEIMNLEADLQAINQQPAFLPQQPPRLLTPRPDPHAAAQARLAKRAERETAHAQRMHRR